MEGDSVGASVKSLVLVGEAVSLGGRVVGEKVGLKVVGEREGLKVGDTEGGSVGASGSAKDE